MYQKWYLKQSRIKGICFLMDEFIHTARVRKDDLHLALFMQ